MVHEALKGQTTDVKIFEIKGILREQTTRDEIDKIKEQRIHGEIDEI